MGQLKRSILGKEKTKDYDISLLHICQLISILFCFAISFSKPLNIAKLKKCNNISRKIVGTSINDWSFRSLIMVVASQSLKGKPFMDPHDLSQLGYLFLISRRK